ESAYRQLLSGVWHESYVDIDYSAPRAWPHMPYLSDDELHPVLKWNRSALPMVSIRDYDIKLVQIILLYPYWHLIVRRGQGLALSSFYYFAAKG
ncbi:MAG: hypothetical protein ACKPKO_49305, partial [Candidatus Fonsibacter sp.]